MVDWNIASRATKESGGVFLLSFVEKQRRGLGPEPEMGLAGGMMT